MKLFLLLAAALKIPLGLDTYLPTPADNPLTEANIVLGRKLFFDKRLSVDNTISCATCHDPAQAFADDLPRAKGVQGKLGPRRSPRILNRAWGRSFFWDGRAASLEEQVTQPIENPLEMDMRLPALIEKLRATPDYPQIDLPQLRRALASYVRTILSGNSPYDRHLAGDNTALSPEQKRGLALFRGKANCISCHLGPNLTDEDFHNTGAGDGNDAGRANGMFKTPGLRNVAQAPPYFHDGSSATLADVIEHYNQGGRKVEHLDPEIQKLHLTAEEKRDLEAFLRALNGELQEGVKP